MRAEETTEVAAHYAFPHTRAGERRRLELFQERLDPATRRRIELLGLALGVRCLEIGGGRGSIARWLCEYTGPDGRVTANDLETGFLSKLSLPNLDVLRHDVRTGDFPEDSFELIHVRAVLMHIPDRMAALRRMVSWLAPGGWLLVEDADFGMWIADLDPVRTRRVRVRRSRRPKISTRSVTSVRAVEHEPFSHEHSPLGSAAEWICWVVHGPSGFAVIPQGWPIRVVRLRPAQVMVCVHDAVVDVEAAGAGWPGGRGDDPVQPQVPGQQPGQGGEQARSAQSGLGRVTCRRSTATSCRSIRISVSLAASLRARSTSQPNNRIVNR